MDLATLGHEARDAHPGPTHLLHEIGEEDPAEEEAIRARQLEQLRRENYGFRKVEVLGGNIGYLQLSNFHDATVGGKTAVAAMNGLSVAGMAIGTLFTLFIVPSLYMLIAKDHGAERRVEDEMFADIDDLRPMAVAE